ncbi:hypothetical protein GRJ2_003464400 [Grus japonensis]|uniref:Uncharacterized protein n=1 Tax=Grus japonensis TaxID=30415 RepID=A0ABC9YK63_GRUJA
MNLDHHEEEEAEAEVITQSLSLRELRDMRKDFSCLPGEHIITWLVRSRDTGASSLELEGREAKQLGSLSREGGIDKAIGKKTQALSLWRRLLSSVTSFNSGNMKKTSVPPYGPVSQLWKDCLKKSENLFEKLSRDCGNSKRISMPVLKTENIERTHHEAPCDFTCMTEKT